MSQSYLPEVRPRQMLGRKDNNSTTRVPIAIFLEPNGPGIPMVVKQATAIWIGVEVAIGKERLMMVTAAHNLKVPLPQAESGRNLHLSRGSKPEYYKIRAIVVFAEDTDENLSTAWVIEDLGATGQKMTTSSSCLVEGVHFCICPGFSLQKPERRYKDFALFDMRGSRNLNREGSRARDTDRFTFERVPPSVIIKVFGN